MSKTICAIATPLQPSGLGVIRLSGDKAFSVADAVFSAVSGEKLENLKGYTARFGSVHDKDGVFDEAVALVFRAPKSYTGENVVEISVHGGVYIEKRLLKAVLDHGAVLAEPGEFTKRAFLNGKMDLSQAEAVANMISAGGKQALTAGINAKNGAVSRKINEIKEILLSAAATVAAFSDYPDEEPSFSGIDRLPEALKTVQGELSTLLRDYDSGKVYSSGVNTAIVGSPNVGKSTLMNLLSGGDRSIVTEIAGTTRDVVEETVSVNGIILRLSDTAGIHDTSDIVEKIGVDKAREKILSSDLILAVFDGSKPLGTEDKQLLTDIREKHAVAVLNKNDLNKEITPLEIEKFGIKTVSVSAKTGDGTKELKTAIENAVIGKELSPDSVFLSTERQRVCADEANRRITEALKLLDDGYTVDAVGVLIDDALNSLLTLTGERATVEVTNKVFEKFCVGK